MSPEPLYLLTEELVEGFRIAELKDHNHMVMIELDNMFDKVTGKLQWSALEAWRDCWARIKESADEEGYGNRIEAFFAELNEYVQEAPKWAALLREELGDPEATPEIYVPQESVLEVLHAKANKERERVEVLSPVQSYISKQLGSMDYGLDGLFTDVTEVEDYWVEYKKMAELWADAAARHDTESLSHFQWLRFVASVDAPMPRVDLRQIQSSNAEKGTLIVRRPTRDKNPNGKIKWEGEITNGAWKNWSKQINWDVDGEERDEIRDIVIDMARRAATLIHSEDGRATVCPMQWPNQHLRLAAAPTLWEKAKDIMPRLPKSHWLRDMADQVNVAYHPPIVLPFTEERWSGVQVRKYWCRWCNERTACIKDIFDARQHQPKKVAAGPGAIRGHSGNWRCLNCGSHVQDQMLIMDFEFKRSGKSPVVWTARAGVYGRSYIKALFAAQPGLRSWTRFSTHVARTVREYSNTRS